MVQKRIVKSKLHTGDPVRANSAEYLDKKPAVIRLWTPKQKVYKPSIKAIEAVAWTFGLTDETYHPVLET